MRGRLALALAVVFVAAATPAHAGEPGDPDELNRKLASNEGVADFAMTRNGAHAFYSIYRVDQPRGPITYVEIRRVGADGSGDVKVSTHAVPWLGVPFQITPKGDRVLYFADNDGDGLYELISAPGGGGPPVTLMEVHEYHDFITQIYPAELVIEPDGKHVIVRSDQSADGRWELFRVATAGGPLERLSARPPGFLGITERQLTPNGSHLIYSARYSSGPELRLHSVPVEGGPVATLSGQLSLDDELGAWSVSADSSGVVFFGRTGNGLGRLRAVPTEGGAATNVGPSVKASDDIRRFVVAADSSFVAYASDAGSDINLYAAPTNGGPDVLLNPPLTGLRSVELDFAITPNSQRVLYRSDHGQQDRIALWSVKPDGSGLAQINGPMQPDTRVLSFEAAPNSRRVAFMSNEGGDYEVYTVELTGKGLVQVSAAGVAHGYAPYHHLSFTPNSNHVLFTVAGRPSTPNKVELFSVAARGGLITKLNGPLRDYTFVYPVVVSPRTTFVVFLANGIARGSSELYAVDLPEIHTCRGRPATILGTDGNDVITGTPGPDVIVGLGGNDVIDALDGDDVVCGGEGRDSVRGGPGKDKLDGQDGDDRLWGGDGRDLLVGGVGADVLRGDASGDVLLGGLGDDELIGGGGPDVLDGGDGNDTALGGGGDDSLVGGRGRDRLDGGSGNDRLEGSPDADVLFGGEDDDNLQGDQGDDVLRGQEGNDIVNGGNGADWCSGGSGVDSATKCEETLDVP